MFFFASRFGFGATVLYRDHKKTVTTNQKQKGNDSSCLKRARRREEGSTDHYRTIKHKTKSRIRWNATKASSFKKKGLLFVHQRRSDLLLEGPPLSYRQEQETTKLSH
jgi:hypothetical protein